MSTDLRTNITAALHACIGGDLTANCSRLLDVLGYRSEKRFVLAPNSAQNFAATFGGDRPLHATQARTEEWSEANVLFQLTDSEVAQTEQMHLLREDGGWNRGVYRSFLFLAIGLAGDSYSRTALATITRAVNRLFMMPTPIFFRYGDKLTLAIILRRPGKRDASQDVLEKVTLIKDIDLRHPHAAHIRILEELALANLRQGQSVSNFDELQSAWARTLDISELNKRFYQELANWYYWAVATVTFPPGDSRDDEETRNAVAVIRLVTRLIFVWFIKEKGLVPDDLFARDKIAAVLHDLSDDGGSYYKAILQNLFFATLNTEMNTPAQPRNRMFRSAAERGGFNRHYGVHSFYRYAALFQIDEASAQALFATIPFLNGGLFECLDRPDQGIRSDGFSDRADNPLHVPNVLFFGHARPLDLNEVFGTRNKQYRVRGLFEIFHRYKFTIEENTPIDEEVALDPELLGKVFENLLAAYNPETRTTARKQTGSFYTPREIVDYMVDEALIAYLAAAMRQQAALTAKTESYLEARLRHLFAYTDEPHRFTADEVIALIEAIDRIKILDPACGSGAFPMGVLHKLVFILRKLDPNNVRWKEQQLARVQRDRLLAEQMEDEKNRERAVKEIDERILDIERSFAEQDHELDYTRKLYLIENCIYGVDIQPIAVQIAKLRFFISLIVDQRVDDAAPNRNVRALPNLETKFVAANALIGLPRSGQMLLRNPEIDRLEEELRRVRQRHFTARTATTKKKYRDEDARLRQRIGELLQQDGWPQDMTVQLAHWDPYDQNAHAEFFDPEWMFGVTEGFDVVIGNPPYGAELSKEDIKQIVKNAKDSTNKNSAALFIDRAKNDFIHDWGLVAFIVPKSLLYSEGWYSAVQSLYRNASQIIDVEQAFENVLLEQVVFVYTNATTYTHYRARKFTDNRFLSDNLIPNKIVDGFSAWICDVSMAELSLALKLIHPNKFMKDVSTSSRGLPIQRSIASEGEFKIIGGKNIGRYKLTGFRGFVHRSEVLRNKRKADQILGAPKVMSQQIVAHIQNPIPHIMIAATVDSDGSVLGLDTVENTYLTTDKIHLNLVAALFNSKLINWYAYKFIYCGAVRTMHFDSYYIGKIPLPDLSSSISGEVVELVDQVLAAKAQDPAADVTALEAEIDRLVYALYGLTAEEIKIVEGAG